MLVKGFWQQTQNVCCLLIEIYVWNCKLYTLKAKFSANISRLSTQSPMPTHRIQHHGTWTCSKHLGGVFWGVYGDTVNHTPDHPHSSLTPQIYGSVWGWNVCSCSGSILHKHTATYIIQVCVCSDTQACTNTDSLRCLENESNGDLIKRIWSEITAH